MRITYNKGDYVDAVVDGKRVTGMVVCTWSEGISLLPLDRGGIELVNWRHIRRVHKEKHDTAIT